MKVTYEDRDFWNLDTTIAGVLADAITEFIHRDHPSGEGIGSYPVEYPTYEEWVEDVNSLVLELRDYTTDSADAEETVWDKLAFFMPRLWT